MDSGIDNDDNNDNNDNNDRNEYDNFGVRLSNTAYHEAILIISKHRYKLSPPATRCYQTLLATTSSC